MHRLRTLVPVSLTIGLAVVWVLLATAHPHRTYHLFPPVIAAAWPAAERVVRRRPLRSRDAGRVTLAAVIVSAGVTVALGLAGDLAGPTVLATRGALGESLLFAALGGLYGWRAASRAKPGLLFSR